MRGNCRPWVSQFEVGLQRKKWAGLVDNPPSFNTVEAVLTADFYLATGAAASAAGFDRSLTRHLVNRQTTCPTRAAVPVSWESMIICPRFDQHFTSPSQPAVLNSSMSRRLVNYSVINLKNQVIGRDEPG